MAPELKANTVGGSSKTFSIRARVSSAWTCGCCSSSIVSARVADATRLDIATTR